MDYDGRCNVTDTIYICENCGSLTKEEAWTEHKYLSCCPERRPVAHRIQRIASGHESDGQAGYEPRSVRLARELADGTQAAPHSTPELKGNLSQRIMQDPEWFYRWAARAEGGSCTDREAISVIFHHPDNPYADNNPWKKKKNSPA